LSNKTKAISIGLVLAILGSIICNAYAKDTITNYTGFGLLLVGVGTCILGVFATAATSLKMHLSQEPASINVKHRMLCHSVWTIGIGVALAVIGSIVASAYEKNTIINDAGFGTLLFGMCVSVIGFFGTMLAILGNRLKQTRSHTGLKIERPRFLFSQILAVGLGTALTIFGSIISRAYAKETMMNYTGFGMLLFGIAVLSIGITGSIVIILKNHRELTGNLAPDQPRLVLGSVWAIGIGTMLVIVGSLLAGSYEKNSLMNYGGFGTLLAGTGVFVYGVFETARISAMGLLSRKLNATNAKLINQNNKLSEFKKEKFSERIRKTGRNLVATSAILNLSGVMVAMGLLFFSLWQLDMIVSGPVWWESSPSGAGWSWAGPGAYANDYFQCFLWRTTVGQAYDILFSLIFVSFIILFASAFFWPRQHNLKNSTK
jgi:hypothetical protein